MCIAHVSVITNLIVLNVLCARILFKISYFSFD